MTSGRALVVAVAVAAGRPGDLGEGRGFGGRGRAGGARNCWNLWRSGVFALLEISHVVGARWVKFGWDFGQAQSARPRGVRPA